MSQQSAVSSQQSAVSSQQRRSVYLDTVKGVAIFLVVFGHCIRYGGNFGLTYLIIYSFHMPLFALVSGYLFFPSVSGKNPASVFIKQLRRLIMPVVSWTLIYWVILSVTTDLRGIMQYAVYALWFLWAIFLCSLAVLAARKFFNDSVMFYAFVLFALLFAPRLATAVFLYPYFVAGYLWHRENFDVKTKSLWEKHKITITICLFLVWLFLFQFYTRDSTVYDTKIYLLGGKMTAAEQFRLDIYRWAIGWAGSLASMALIKFMRPMKFLCVMGANTLGIYVISSIIDSFRITLSGLFTNFIQAVIITAICCTLSIAISRSKILNRFLLGGR